MKKRFLLVLAAMLCLVMIALSIPVMADGEPTTSIMGHNLALEDAVDIIYYVDFQNVPDGAESGVLIWRTPQNNYTYGTEDEKLSTVGKDYGYDKFIFPGVAAKMMTQNFYAVSYIKDGDEITYSKLDKYSVLQYAYNKKGDTTVLSGGTITLGELLEDLLEYGASAQKYFGYNLGRLANATYYQITVEGGTLPDGTTKGLYQAGANVTLSSNFVDFDHWENGSENAVGTTNSINITVSQAETYTAVLSSGSIDPGADPGFVPEPIAYSEGLEFATNNDGTCYVEGRGTCTDTEIIIPPTSPIGDRVVAIGNDALSHGGFYGCTTITSVVVPNGVTKISSSAFYGCSSLASITLPDTLTNIGSNAFMYCVSLTNIELPNSVTLIGRGAFSGCSSLQYNTYSKAKYLGNTDNPYFALIQANDTSIISCTIHPTNTKVIVGAAFEGCSKMTSVNIPNTIEKIPQRAFCGCSALTSIAIPNSVTSIEYEAFASCNRLTSVTFAENSQLASIGEKAFVGCSALANIEIPNSVMGIGVNAFNSCTALTSITIPGSVTSIGADAFRDCTSLLSVTIESGVTSIVAGAFANCSRLTTVEIPASVTSIGQYAFSSNNSLTSVYYHGTSAQWQAIIYGTPYIFHGNTNYTLYYVN